MAIRPINKITALVKIRDRGKISRGQRIFFINSVFDTRDCVPCNKLEEKKDQGTMADIRNKG